MAGRLRLRPLAADDEAELVRIHSIPEVARWWDEPEPGFPFSDDPESTRLVIEVDGRVAGMIQYAEEPTPKYRHASIDLFLDPSFWNRGHGTEAVRRVVRLLIDERGHHRITIDPAAANAAAIRAYERDQDGRGWHDGLLMELLAAEEQGETQGDGRGEAPSEKPAPPDAGRPAN